MKNLTFYQQSQQGALLTRTQLLRDPEALKFLTAQELMEQTDSMVLWLEGGDHCWKTNESIVESRYYASELTKFIRQSGDTECTHAMGAADLIYNLGKAHMFGRILPVFIAYNHDRIENNKDLLSKKGKPFVTAANIVLTCWNEDSALQKKAIWFLNQITDSPHLKGKDRMAEQIDRCNADKSGLLGELRITEKMEALTRDLFNAQKGVIPFKNDMAKAKKYLTLRVETIDAIKSPGSKPLKELYMSKAYLLTQKLSGLERRKKRGKDNNWFVSSCAPLRAATNRIAMQTLSYCNMKQAIHWGLSGLAPERLGL